MLLLAIQRLAIFFGQSFSPRSNRYREALVIVPILADMVLYRLPTGTRTFHLFYYQSSFTAITASFPAAARPASHAVTVPDTTTAAHSASNLPPGTARSIVQ